MNIQPDPSAELGLVTLTGLATFDTTVVYDGAQSVRLRSRKGLLGLRQNSQATWPTFPVVAGDRYIISFWANSSSPAGRTDLTVELDPGTGTFATLVVWSAPTGGWRLLMQVEYAAAVTGDAQFRFTSELPPAAGALLYVDDWYVDLITVEELKMPITKVGVCNIALGRIGISKSIAALTESNEEANQCNRYFDHVLEEALGEADWGFARRRVTLTAYPGTPPEPWSYQYVFPVNCVRPLRIDDEQAYRYPENQIPFATETDATAGRLLYTDQEDAVLIYTHYETDTSKWTTAFADYLAWRLAVELAMPLTADEALQKRIERRTMMAIETSLSKEFRSEVEHPELDASWIAERD